MGTELRRQYDLLAEGAQERTRSDPVNDAVGDLQPIKEAGLMSREKALRKKTKKIFKGGTLCL